MTACVTPSLYVGADALVFDTVEVGDVVHGVNEIAAGRRVRVATYEMAAQILRELGVAEPIIEDRIHFARTGKVLRAV